MMKLANCLGAVAFIAMSGVASASDTYYIQDGMFSKIGNISASGFFKTSGIGMDTVTGFDITLTRGNQSITLCSSSAFGCKANDFIPDQMGVVDTGTRLLCTANCLFFDDEVGFASPSGFVFAGSNAGKGASEQYRVDGYQNTTQTPAPKGTFVIAAEQLAAAPEIDPAATTSFLTLLVGGLAVLGTRKRKTVSA